MTEPADPTERQPQRTTEPGNGAERRVTEPGNPPERPHPRMTEPADATTRRRPRMTEPGNAAERRVTGPTDAAGRRPPLRRWPLARSVLTAVNGTTIAGLAVAVLTGARVRRGRHGILVAEGYRRRVPPATCFTVGSVVITRRSADWLLHESRADLLAHESRHAGQYAVLGPLFWPAYWMACGYSWVVTGSYGARNAFERHAGLAKGGYAEAPLRPWLHRVRRRRD